jgi:stage II sporulation protein D
VISSEPVISVGIMEHRQEVRGVFQGHFELPNSVRLQGVFMVLCQHGNLILTDNEGIEVIRAPEIRCHAMNGASSLLSDVAIGINFHWERKEEQLFQGNLRFLVDADSGITAINEIRIEQYLTSVISSEMSAEAPIELLKAQAVTSRSWMVAMLERQKKIKTAGLPPERECGTDDKMIRWYDREDHALFDVCADDHCQRYQGITKIIAQSAEEAVSKTRGQYLVYLDEICDARFSKACGGRTELFEHTWEETPVPYLQSIADSHSEYPPVMNESDAECWITSSPDVFCNTADSKMLQHVLPTFDQQTADFFRWSVVYTRKQLEELLLLKTGIDFGTLLDFVPLKRGPSGRMYELKVIGSNRTMVVGKELEIRRWLSSSHLYSSAFIVKADRDAQGIPVKFTFLGAGWGHGVGLCQIGAAVMAAKGYKAEEILEHYFGKCDLKKLYT